MISSLAPQNVALRTLAATKADGPAPASAPSPAPALAPADTLDFTRIDSPVKAALLPILDPGVLASIFAGAAAGRSIPGGATVEPTSSQVWAHIGPQVSYPEPLRTAAEAFVTNLSDANAPLQEAGVVGGRDVDNTLTVDNKAHTARWTGPNNFDDLTLFADQKTGVLHVDGHLGSVDTHLTFAALPSKKDDNGGFGVHTEGTLGGVAMNVDTIVSAQTLTTGPDGSTTLTSTIRERGKLGSDEIARDYTVTGYNGGTWLTVSGQGTVAGVPTQITTSTGRETPKHR